MKQETVEDILRQLQFPGKVHQITPFCREEDGSAYDVWKVCTGEETLVLKKTCPEERETYETFFPQGGGAVPKVYGFSEIDGEVYVLMEFVEGETMSCCTREKLILALDALIETQERYWDNAELADRGWNFTKWYPAREKRLAYMEDLADGYRAYLEAARSVPRTLCNDDLLPFNVLVQEGRAVILDWEFAGILPYPCAIARLLAFGEEHTDFMFQMSREDKAFGVKYYYENFIRGKGISWKDYCRTIQLFFLKEYCEWVYFGRSNGKQEDPNYQKYYEKARDLEKALGYGSEYCRESTH